MKTNFKIWAGGGIALITLLAASAQASVSLTDGNSSVTIDPASSAGINNWTVDGVNQLNQEWFWYRGTTGPALSIDTISAALVTPSTPSSVTTSYLNNQLSVSVVYSLLGGTPGSGSSQLSMQISVQNLTAGALTFYNYGDFSLGGGLTSAAMGKNISGLFNEADVTKANGANVQVLATPGAQSGEASLYPNTLNEFAAGLPLNGSLSAGPGHATDAFGWDLAAGQTRTFSLVENLQAVNGVPDRGQWFLIWIGLGSCLLMTRFIPKMEYRFARNRVSPRR